MQLSRRGFLKATGVGTTIALGFDVSKAEAEMREFKISRTTETRSTCPYCAVSCGVIIHTLGDKAKNATPAVVHVEGDPDHPINRGTLCPKGATLATTSTTPTGCTKPQVRRPGSDHWEDISLGRRDRGHRAAHQGHARPHLRREERARARSSTATPGIAMIGGCTDTNEFNFLQWKVITALGVPYRDSQARV